jgi:hypothetical protein
MEIERRHGSNHEKRNEINARLRTDVDDVVTKAP